MAAELPRPGVQVIQEFESSAPTIITPTLIPFVTGPAKEIVEFTDADGLVNADAEQGTYDQLPQVISQSAFPSPRGNIQEVNVEEATIRTALLFGGSLSELDKDPGSAFLASHNEARRAAIRLAEIAGAGVDLDGKTLVLALDVRAPLNTTQDVAVTFATVGGGNLTAQQVADQINSAVGSTVATVIASGANERVQILSPTYGAGSSVTIRAGGSANSILVGLTDATEYRVEGAGFHAQDQNNNTTLSPYVVFSQGRRLEDNTSTAFVTAGAAEAQIGQLHVDADGDDVFEEGAAPSITFTGSGSIDLKVGDHYYADGVRPASGLAEVSRVETSRFKLGTVNTALSTFDADGNVITAVYDDAKVNTLLAGVPFSPRYGWWRARNISEENAAATAASLTGSISGAPATPATLVSSGAGVGPFELAGLTLITEVTIDGVSQGENTFTFVGGPFADVDAVVAAIGANIPGVVPTNDAGELRLSTDVTGAGVTLTLKATSTALAALGLTAGNDTGTDVEFVDIAAVLTGGTQTFPFNETLGETLVIEGSDDGGDTWAAFSRTFTWPTADSAFADIAALIAALNTAGSWDGGTLPTEFTISNSGDAIVITSTATGSLAGIRIGAASTGIGATTDADLLFTSGDSDVGEENLQGLIFKFRLNDRAQIYQATFLSNSLDDAIEEINEAAGTTVASAGGGGSDQLILTSPLKGAASRVEVVDDGTNNQAASAFGFGSGNKDASGSGRPNADFHLDVSGNAVIGAEILRSAVTGVPFANATAGLYIQYTALRLDVSPRAAEPGLLSISDTATLDQVLGPINSANPLALAMFFQLINAPNISCKGMGVSEATAAAPEGTLLAYTEVAEFIESEEVYSIAPLTHDPTVFQMFTTHVNVMSAADQKGERVLIQNPAAPSRALDSTIASGLSAGTTATQNQLNLDVNPAQSLVDAGINPSDPISEDEDLFVEIIVNGSVRRYNVASVSSTLIVFRTSFSADFNVDDFYTQTPLTEALTNLDWSMRVRGAELLIPGSTLPDKDAIAETVAGANRAIGNRRVVSVFPDVLTASLSGTAENLPAYYGCAAITGMVASNPPQQGFTNLNMAGFIGVRGSNDKFSTRQLNVMAGGGTYILVQDTAGAPITCRHQLTTDLTSLETREFSITKVVDFVAKFMRTGLRNFIGTFNITQPFLDTLSTVIQGMLQFLQEAGVILGGDLNNLVQDKNNPDTVLVDITLDVPFPANYIRLILVV